MGYTKYDHIRSGAVLRAIFKRTGVVVVRYRNVSNVAVKICGGRTKAALRGRPLFGR